MKIIETENTIRIYGDDLVVKEKLDPGYYSIGFNKLAGFFLEKKEPLLIGESVVYGKHTAKADKVIRRFKDKEGNLGVILSGQKGIGKSLCARIICNRTVDELRMPVILLDTNVDGVHNFISSIKQDIAVFADEFEKTYQKCNDDNNCTQEKLLSMFDGTAVSFRRLYIITCNDIYDLSNLLLNRPGRFHFHFRFKAPDKDEIVYYMKDKLDPAYYNEIDNVLNFAVKVPLNYDCLRAIAIELNTGETFSDIIDDLNIKNIDTIDYNCKFYLSNNEIFESTATYHNIFNRSQPVLNYSGPIDIEATINKKNLIYDKINNMFYVDKIELYDIETYCDADERKYKDVDIKRIEVFKADNFDKFNF